MATILERALLAAGALALSLSLVDAPLGVVTFAAIATVLSIVRFATNRARWQMAPAYLAVAWTWLEIATDLPSGARVAGAAVALLLLALAAALSVGLPIPKLPRPDGPFGVGTITTTEERHDPSAPSTGPRRLFIKVWYPAPPNPAQRPRDCEPLWSEFREAPGIPSMLMLLTGYLRQVRTHSVRDAPASPAAIGGPVVLYHHGLISISAENSLLAESLASHGYVVVSTRHLDQRAELDAVNANTSPADAARAREMNTKLLGALNRTEQARTERARLSYELYRHSTGTATIVSRRAADSRHVLDRLPALLARIPGHPPAAEPPIAAVGLSLGGAVATELSKTDTRCRAVANIDGGLYGPHPEAPLRVPYLMLYSELNSGGNDLALESAKAAFREVTVPGSKHLDFHDAAFVLPILRWFGRLGKVPPAEVAARKNHEIRQFLDQALSTTAQSPPRKPQR